MTIPSTHHSGHVHGEEGFHILEPAVEVIARARYERYDSHFSMPGGLTWEQYAAEDPSGADAMYRDDAREEVAALTAAGLLVTEQEWAVDYSRPHFGSWQNGWLKFPDRERAQRFAEDARDAKVLSRGVTPWTEQA